jgi:hypothetical protein
MTHKQNPLTATLKTVGKTVKNGFKAIWKVILVIVQVIKSFFVAIEKTLKIIAIFIIALSAAVLFLSTSFYLISSAFGLKESPAFQGLREQIVRIYVLSAEDELKEMEVQIQTDIKAERDANNHQK